MNGIDIIYIVGSGRSGSTILEKTLGQVDGVFSLGEVRLIWERGVLEEGLCGCGIPLEDCDFWRSVLDRVCSDRESFAKQMKQWSEKLGISKTLPLRKIVSGRQYKKVGDQYINILRRLYEAASQISGCKWLVDSSKNPLYGWYLTKIRNVKVHMVHLVRDPRGYVYSMKKRKWDKGSSKYLSYSPSWYSVPRWLCVNITTQALAGSPFHYLRIRYEDFVRKPKDVLVRILNWAGHGPSNTDFIQESKVIAEPTHSAAGNPCRLQKEAIRLVHDDEWTREIGNFDYILSTISTLPLLIVYGYRP